MNEFGIVYLLPKEARLYHERLSYEIEDKFHLKGTFELNAPSHITLKYRFKAETIRPVETAIQQFCIDQLLTGHRAIRLQRTFLLGTFTYLRKRTADCLSKI